MFISEKLIFLELHKTGSTHVRALLTDLVGGKIAGKHNAATPEVLAKGLPILGSVRNPWSWYVSLWTYGCEGKGVLRQRLLSEEKWMQTRQALAKSAASPTNAAGKPRKRAPGTLPDYANAERAAYWYADSGNVEAFREWLSVILSPAARRVVEQGYRRSPIGQCGGLLTFRYFTLFVEGGAEQPDEFRTVRKLAELDKSKCLVTHFIKNESLEEDLLKALAACGVELTPEQIEGVMAARKRNVSTRPLSVTDYFTPELAELVGDRERFLCEKFGYTNPMAAKAAAAAPAAEPGAEPVAAEAAAPQADAAQPNPNPKPKPNRKGGRAKAGKTAGKAAKTSAA